MLCEALRATHDLEIRENIVQLLWDLEAGNRECRPEPGARRRRCLRLALRLGLGLWRQLLGPGGLQQGVPAGAGCMPPLHWLMFICDCLEWASAVC